MRSPGFSLLTLLFWFDEGGGNDSWLSRKDMHIFTGAKSAPVAFLVGADLRGLVRDERDWKEGKEAMKVANLEGAKIEVNPTKQVG